MTPDENLLAHASALIDAYRRAALHIVTAESCTGGLVAAMLTEIPGSSDVVERGFVTYSNEAKIELLGVPSAIVDKHGAVSPHVARAMAEGALEHSRADVAIAVTGIAGPAGGTPTKPVGLVYFAAERRGREPLLERHMFAGDRHAIRMAAVATALDLLDRQLGD